MKTQITAVLESCQLFFSRHKLENGTAHEKLLFLEDKASEQMLIMVSLLLSIRWACGQDLITLHYVDSMRLVLLLAHIQGIGLLLYVHVLVGGPCEEAGQYMDKSNKYCFICSPSV